MFAQHLVQRGVQQMSGSVVAHDIVAACHVHFSNGHVTNLWLTRDHFTNMDNDTGRGFPYARDFDLPVPLILNLSPAGRREYPSHIGSGQGEETDVPRVINLPARFDVEASLG